MSEEKKVEQDERGALNADVRAFLENLAEAGSEPLNSVAAYRDKESRRHFMVEVRNGARALLARAASTSANVAQGEEVLTLNDEWLESARFDASEAINDHDGEFTGCLDWCRAFAGIVLRCAATPVQTALTIERAREIAAQCWCQPETSGITMDPLLCEAFARILTATQSGDKS